MKKLLPFQVLFAVFVGTTFINCFASVYMFLENITGVDTYDCKRSSKDCHAMAAETMWYTFNCHNFGETFRHCVYEEMRDAASIDTWTRISAACDDIHTRAWSIIHLTAGINWNNRPEWGCL